MTLPALRVAAIWTGVGLGHVAALGFLWGRPSAGRTEGDGLLVLALLAPVAPPAMVAAAPSPPSLSPVRAPSADPGFSAPPRPLPVEAALAAAAPAAPAAAMMEPPRFLSRAEPPYPRSSRRAGVEGTARVRLQLGSDGTLLAATIAASSGSPALDAAALEAARASRYAPARAGGLPVPSETEASYRFQLR